MYQKSSETVQYVETANTSHSSGRAEVRPDRHLVREREQEPVRVPDAADVEAGIDSGADDREDRHRLGGAVDAGAPLLPEQEEDGAR